MAKITLILKVDENMFTDFVRECKGINSDTQTVLNDFIRVFIKTRVEDKKRDS